MAPIWNLVKTQGSRKWEWTRDADLAFWKHKMAFTDTLILQHFNLQELVVLQTDARCVAVSGMLNQYDRFRLLWPVDIYSHKCSLPKQNYDKYDQELVAIVETLNQWRHYLERTDHKVLIQCEHINVEYFQTSEVLSRREARRAGILSFYDFVIEHFEGEEEPGKCTIKMARLWDRLQATHCTATGIHGNYHR